MNTRRSFAWLAFTLIGLVGLLLVGRRLIAAPEPLRGDTTGDLLFYSPILPIGQPQIELVKTVNNNSPKAGDEIIYTLAFSNTNPGSRAFNVRLYELMPAGLKFLSSNPVADAAHDGMILFTAPSIGPTTEGVRVNIRGRVLEGYDHLYNHTLVVADGVTPAHASLMTEVTQPPAWLRLVKTGYSTVLINDELVYTLMCQNSGDTPVNEVTLIDVLPGGLPLVGASPLPDQVALPVLKWSLGDMLPGERRTVVITTTAPASTGLITNTALADARQRVVTETMFSTRVVSQGAILRVSKTSSPSAVHPGDELVYTLFYENAGNAVATGVRLTDTFPTGIIVHSANPPTPGLDDQQGVWVLDTLNPDDTGQIVISTTVTQKGGTTLLNLADIVGQPGSFPGHAELETDVQKLLMYLPISTRVD
jgi:uncharacterized repeat protein (TIGR01451 family)